MSNKTYRHKTPAQQTALAQKATNTQIAKTAKRTDSYGAKIAPKAQSVTRRDISAWKSALKAAMNIETPRRARLQNLYADIMLDAHLTSQIELRRQSVLAAPFVIKRDGVIDEQLTDMITSAQWANKLNSHLLDTEFFGSTLVELLTSADGELEVVLIPRTNVVPEQGLILLKEDDSKGIDYRAAREYGTWLLEFGDPTNFGLLNKAVPHVLFKKFAQACWSELCEIYGIPPRVLHTNTQDPEMLSRAEQMMRDLGAAAWYIVDSEEKFEFATGVSTNGDVYNNLIALCKSEISLLFIGAIIGQDTLNGNRSKEEVSIGLLDTIVSADKRRIEGSWNSTILPALVRIGIVPDGLSYEYQPQEDLEKLFVQTHKVMQYMEVDPEWVKDKFGIQVIANRQSPSSAQLSAGSFFD